MKKLLVLAALQAFIAAAIAQDADQIRKDFEAQLKDKKTLYGHDSLHGKYYNLRGFKMYCETYGQGQPLLIIHGNGGSINNFIYQVPYFAKKYKVIIADSRAQGKSADT